MSKTITIKEEGLSEIVLGHVNIARKYSTRTAESIAYDCVQAIIKSSVSIDGEIRAQAEEIAKKAKLDAALEYSKRFEQEIAKEKSVLTATFTSKIEAARQQGHQQGAKDASSLMQQLEEAHRAKARAQKELEVRQDPFSGNNPDAFVASMMVGGKTTRRPDGVYHEDKGGAVLFRCYKTAFQTAWIKEIKQAMQEPYANYAVIVSVCPPGPRQLKEIKEANRAGVYVCAPENVSLVSYMIFEWIDKTHKQALIQSAKQDSAGALYDWVTGGEMQTLQSILHDSLKAKAKAIKGLETQIAHLKDAMDKEVEVSNQVFLKMQEKAGVKALPPSEKE